jgi:hypothetical protein
MRQDEISEFGAVGSVEMPVRLISGMRALSAGRMMSHHDDLCRVISGVTALMDGITHKLQHGSVIITGMLGQEPVEIYTTVLDLMMIVYHFLGLQHGYGITAVVVGPQCATQEQPAIDLHTLFVQEMEVGVLDRGPADQGSTLGEITVIMFVIAHDHDHMGEPFCASLHKTTNSVTTIIGTIEISRHQDVARQNQYIHIIEVAEIQITKF